MGLQKIETPKKYRAVDTSGNNNHGQIYSGRGLEFDGVTDYLTGPTSAQASYLSIAKNCTVACWVKIHTMADRNPWGIGAGSDRMGLSIDSAGGMAFTSWNGEAYTHASTTGTIHDNLQINIWYRVISTMEPTGTKKLYINGILQTGTLEAYSSPLANGSSQLYLGKQGNADNDYFSGIISDFQAWDATWTQSDVTFDYLNPESLALNNGGTSLTESNLKLWYPMQDGHRGQQSYVLDGANTGLSDDIVSDGGFDTDVANGAASTSWTCASGTWSISDGVAKHETAGDTNQLRTGSGNVLTVGVSYKIEFDIVSITGGSITLDTDGASTPARSTVGTHTEYLTATNTFLDFTPDSSFAGTIDNVKIYPVNDKHPATTVFLGDELITSDYADNGTFTNDNGNWAAHGTGAVLATWSGTAGNGGDNGGLTVNPNASNGDQGATLTTSYMTTLVAGRTYRVTADIKGPAADVTDYFFQIGGVKSSTFNVTTSFATYDEDIVATSDAALIIGHENENGSNFFVDNVSVKEVGTATGWTDADQQLDIPQTALQSYNQLAWFDGADDKVTIADTSNDHDNIFNGGGSVSAWIYPFGIGESSQGNIISKALSTGGQSGWVLRLEDPSGSTCEVGFLRGHDNTDGSWDTDSRVITYGEWTHVVITYNDDDVTNNPNFYINGELVDSADVVTPIGNEETDASQAMIIGNQSAATDRTFDGAITEVSLWNEILTQAQVNELYNDGKALDATTHSYAATSTNLKGYWRNNGLAQWTDLSNDYSNHGTVTCSETLLLPAGVDASRDTQGFLMNRQKGTNSLNLARVNSDPESSPFVIVRTNPLYTGSVVTKASVSAWVKFLRLPQHTDKAHIFDARTTDGNASFMLWMDTSNVLQFRFYSDASATFKYVQHDLDTDVGGVGYDASEEFVVDKWINLTATFETAASDTHMHLYANGKLIAGGNNHYTDAFNLHNAGDSAVSIGANLTSSATPAIDDEYVGHYIIDDALIYRDKALTAAEILRNYNAGKRSHR